MNEEREFLNFIYDGLRQEIELTHLSANSHLDDAQRVVASIAALRAISGQDEVQKLIENPTLPP